uniref:Peptidase M12B domain-containing protein n=1 Tax=Romanomermis culicivorax TaxID=13658 RepID=A0A915L4L2_ROMCU
TRNEIFALFNNHIKAVNAIYESTDFGGVRGVNFNVQRTTIWDSSSCPNSDLEDPKKNSFCEDNVDVSNFLNLHSIKNHSDFCLAYVLTSRDFVGGTLGLAWVASTTSGGLFMYSFYDPPTDFCFSAKRESFGYSYEITSSGGLCEPYKWYSEGSKRVRRSLNTGIITLVNYHNRVPMKVSQLTLAHEIGHNFGSPHDFPASCQPGSPEGNYIMFASATSGDKPNNAKFSPCSVANISAVLKEVLAQPPHLDMSGIRRNCLIDPMTSFCGNGVVEDGEQCDCGYDESECEQRQDHCCYARTTRGKLNENRCQRLPNANCR